jgi:Zn-dependent protease with chaperone function
MPADNISTGMLLLSWGATYFIHSTCLIAGTWLFLLASRTAGHVLRETLWKMALVGGVVTASFQMCVTPGKMFGDLTVRLDSIALPVAATSTAPRRIDASAANASAFANRPDRDGDRLSNELPDDSPDNSWAPEFDPKEEFAATLTGSDTAHPAAVELAAESADHSFRDNLIGRGMRYLSGTPALPMALAIAAAMLGIARCIWQTISLRRQLAECHRISAGPARALLTELLRMIPRAPEVVLLWAPDGAEPAAFGINRWTIVLPQRAVVALSEDELRALLAHELAHLVRGDSLWLCICRVLCSCLAFQPLNHLARREWQRTAEFLCDNWAISRTGSPLALARCLTEVASWRLETPAPAAILAATGRKSGLVDRIERLLDARLVFDHRSDLGDRRRTAFAGAVVLACLAFCAPRVQLVAAPSPGQSAQDSSRAAQFTAPLAENEVDNSQPTSAARLQAGGQMQTGDGLETGSTYQTTNGHHTATDGASLLEALNHDLLSLENELDQLAPLLRENATPQAATLAKRLRGQIARLKHRRETLKSLSRKFVN